MSFLKRIKENYILVYIHRMDVKTDLENGTLYIYLFESNFGNRKVEYKSSIKHSGNLDAIDFYCEKVYPWLNGKYFKDIPSYWDIDKESKKFKIQCIYRTHFEK